MATATASPAKVSKSPKANQAPKGKGSSLASLRRAADLFKMAGDATRLGVLMLLVEKDRNVTEICADLGGVQSQPAVSHHLSLLRHGRFIEPRRDGKNNYYGLTPTGRVLAQTAERLVEGLD